MALLRKNLKSAFGCFKTEVIADIAKKLSSVWLTTLCVCVAITEAESVVRNQRFAIFYPHSGGHKVVSIAGCV